jgi:molybdopterin molybdotransferase
MSADMPPGQARVRAGDDCEREAALPLGVEQAIDVLLGHSRPITGTDRIAVAEARNRVLAEPLTSPIDMPVWDNSAMDGYALCAADAVAHAGRLRVAQRIPAGSSGTPLAPGTAARIFTGAPLPDGADTVVMQEDCAIDGDLVQVPGDLKTGANVRRRGEDLRAGDLLLPAGTRLGPQHLGLAASVGVADLTVKRRLRVAFVASGDELVMPGRPLAPGQIYNSNRFLFSALLEALGCTVIDLGIVEDRLEATVEALAAAAEQADLVLASGGVSVGDEDHVRPAVERLGSLDLWRVAMRPGKPLAFGHIGDTPFIGSPGNPVSLFVTFCLFARPFILRMQGVAGDLRPLHLPVRAGFDWPTPTKRREYLRARLDQDADGSPVAQIFSSRSSAALTSLTWADGLVVMPQGRTLTTGETISFIPFSELLD